MNSPFVPPSPQQWAPPDIMPPTPQPITTDPVYTPPGARPSNQHTDPIYNPQPDWQPFPSNQSLAQWMSNYMKHVGFDSVTGHPVHQGADGQHYIPMAMTSGGNPSLPGNPGPGDPGSIVSPPIGVGGTQANPQYPPIGGGEPYVEPTPIPNPITSGPHPDPYGVDPFGETDPTGHYGPQNQNWNQSLYGPYEHAPNFYAPGGDHGGPNASATGGYIPRPQVPNRPSTNPTGTPEGGVTGGTGHAPGYLGYGQHSGAHYAGLVTTMMAGFGGAPNRNLVTETNDGMGHNLFYTGARPTAAPWLNALTGPGYMARFTPNFVPRGG